MRPVGGERLEDSFRGLACANVGRGEEVESVIGAKKGTELASSLESLRLELVDVRNRVEGHWVYLFLSFWCKLHSVVWDCLVNLSVL